MSWDEIGRRQGTDKASRSDTGVFAGNVGHGYLAHYERILGPRRDEPLRLLEIGVQHGYSLRTWEEALPKAEIVGVEIHPPDGLQPFLRARLNVFDIEDAVLRERFLANYPGGFDVIIDDAGHQSAQQIATLELLWPHVRPGGYYVIEDIGCGYEPYYGGNPEGGPGSVIHMLKGLIDDIHGHRRDDIRSFYLALGIAFLERA